MVNIKSKKCLEENCNKQPNFNLPDKIGGLYCNEHKKENMINVTEKRQCKEENCNKRPSFNLPDKIIGIYCSKHKTNDMI